MNKYASEIENDYMDWSDMHPLSSAMEQQHLQNLVDIMGDVKKDQFGSENSLDNVELKR